MVRPPPLSSPFSSSSSPSPPLLPVPRVSAEIPHSPPNKPVSQDAEVRSFVYAFSAFFLSLPQNSVEEVLSLSFTLFACRRLSQEKRNKKKKPNHNARSLHDLGRPRAAESRRGGPDGPRRGSAVSVGGHGGGAEQGRDGRERSIEASQSLSLSEKSKLPPRSSRSSGRRRRKKKSFIFCSLLLSECPARTT